MRSIIPVVIFLSFCDLAMGQKNSTTRDWYSETANKGIIIQNSLPRGGPYYSSTGKNSNYSFLIFFTRIINETAEPLKLTINFPADSFATGDGGNVT